MYLSMRSGAWFVRRVWESGLPLDLALWTRYRRSLLHSLPMSLVDRQWRVQMNDRVDHGLYSLQSGHDALVSPAVRNDELPSRILAGRVQVCPGISRLTASGVQFTDGTHVDNVDTILCATGRPYITLINVKNLTV